MIKYEVDCPKCGHTKSQEMKAHVYTFYTCDKCTGKYGAVVLPHVIDVIDTEEK